MTEADRERFGRAMLVLSEAFNEPVSQVRATAYFETLADLPIEHVERAARTWLRSGKFFPRPSELREAIEGVAQDRALLAWHELTSEIRRVGFYGTPQLSAATVEALRATWGSWQAVCSGLPAPGETQHDFEHKRFVANYQASERRDLAALGPSRAEASRILAEVRAGTIKTIPDQGATR
jgi:hypothetical protein